MDKAKYLKDVFTYYDAEAIAVMAKDAIKIKEQQINTMKKEVDRYTKILERANQVLIQMENEDEN